MKPTISPQLARQVLKYVGLAVGVATVLVDLWSRGQLNWSSAIVAGGAYMLGKGQEAPGGVAIWKLPEDVRESLRPTQPIPAKPES